MNVNRTGIIGQILRVSIISAAIALSPALLFVIGAEAGTTGEGAYVILFLVTIPLGLVIFFLGIISSTRSYINSLSDSEKQQLGLKLRRVPWLILLIIISYVVVVSFLDFFFGTQ